MARACIYIGGGLSLNLLLLVSPWLLTARLPALLADPRVLSLLALGSIFCAVELAGLSGAGQPWRPHQDVDRQIARLESLTGLCLLLLFWATMQDMSHDSQGLVGWRGIHGGLLMLLGSILRGLAIQRLGNRFVSEISIAPDQTLEQGGLYRWLRHPSETGLLAAGLGVCLFSPGTLPLALWFGGLLPLTILRVSREDRCLEAAFGDAFRGYARRVKRLVPWVY